MNLFERLEKANLIKRGKVQESAVINVAFSNLLDLLDAVSDDTAGFEEDFRPSVHTHCAALGMSGGRAECSEIGCRMRRIDELARFAAFYSEHVFIDNFLSDLSPSFGYAPSEDSMLFREEVIDDIRLLLHIRPLIESGTINVFAPPDVYCPSCFADRVFGLKAGERLRKAEIQLSRSLFKEISIDFRLGDTGYEAVFAGSERLFGHEGSILFLKKPPEPIASIPRLLDRVHNGESVTLSQNVRRKLKLHKIFVSEIIHSLTYQMSVAGVLGTSFLTHRDLDLEILSYITGSADLDRRNAIAAKHLRAIVPFAGDVPIPKLLQLRRREEEAFIRFRSVLDSALGEMVAQRESFTERDARLFYADVIAPELARLDQRVREAKRDLVKVPLVSAVGTAAVIAFGLYSGMVPPELKEIASALGLAKVVSDTVTKVGELIDVEKSIRPEKFYFLWKVKHLDRKTRRGHSIF